MPILREVPNVCRASEMNASAMQRSVTSAPPDVIARRSPRFLYSVHTAQRWLARMVVSTAAAAIPVGGSLKNC